MNAIVAGHPTVQGMAQLDDTIRPLLLPAVLPVVGVSFHQDVVSALRVGDRLEVLAEPENPYDPQACVFLRDGEVVGHVPRALAGRLRRTGSRWHACVEEVLRGDMATGLRVRILGAEVADVQHTDPEAAPDDRGTGEPGAENPRHTDVHARSGRLLGRFVGRDEGAVVVSTEDGRTVRFPESLVILG